MSRKKSYWQSGPWSSFALAPNNSQSQGKQEQMQRLYSEFLQKSDQRHLTNRQGLKERPVTGVDRALGLRGPQTTSHDHLPRSKMILPIEEKSFRSSYLARSKEEKELKFLDLKQELEKYRQQEELQQKQRAKEAMNRLETAKNRDLEGERRCSENELVQCWRHQSDFKRALAKSEEQQYEMEENVKSNHINNVHFEDQQMRLQQQRDLLNIQIEETQRKAAIERQQALLHKAQSEAEALKAVKAKEEEELDKEIHANNEKNKAKMSYDQIRRQREEQFEKGSTFKMNGIHEEMYQNEMEEIKCRMDKQQLKFREEQRKTDRMGFVQDEKTRKAILGNAMRTEAVAFAEERDRVLNGARLLELSHQQQVRRNQLQAVVNLEHQMRARQDLRQEEQRQRHVQREQREKQEQELRLIQITEREGRRQRQLDYRRALEAQMRLKDVN